VKILITGANGFLGSHLCEVATSNSKNTVIASVRKGANLDHISGIQNLTIQPLSYQKAALLIEELHQLKGEFGQFDLVIHNAGITHSNKKQQFLMYNTELTETLVYSIEKSSFLSKTGKFSYISSMAAVGPAGADGPVSTYGESKLACEKMLAETQLNYLVFRPGGIYGSRDRAFLPLVKAVNRRIYPCIPRSDQKMKLIHAHDAATNILLISSEKSKGIYHLSDSQCYTHIEFKSAFELALKKRVLFFNPPVFLAKVYLSIAEKLCTFINIEPTITLEKFNEVSRDWDVSDPDDQKDLKLTFKYTLETGLEETINYYKSNQLI
jgi:nucleoside-diphosphate-sugar epimerase